MRGAPRRVPLGSLQVVYVEGNNNNLRIGAQRAQRVWGITTPLEGGR